MSPDDRPETRLLSLLVLMVGIVWIIEVLLR